VGAQHGLKDVTLLFADVLIEDEELYRFNEQCSQNIGLPITRICVGKTPWQLFREQGMIANAKYPICSIYLKREPLDAWHRANCLEMDSIIYVGMDATEWNRLNDMRQVKANWRIEAPMTEAPLWDKCRMIEETERLGIQIPRLYRMGFPHNNCGGRCVRAGISHFVHLYRVLPDKYLEWENEEQQTIVELTARGVSSAWFSILKDRRGGTSRTMTLKELRVRIEAGEKFARNAEGDL
jgi:hypothetical protein